MYKCFFCISLVICILTMNIYVFASEPTSSNSTSITDDYNEYLNSKSGWENTAYGILTFLGICSDAIGLNKCTELLDTAVESMGYISREQFISENYNSDNNSITFSPEFVAQFYTEFNNYIYETYGYKIYSACKYSPEQYINYMKYFGHTTKYLSSFTEVVNNHDLNIYFPYGTYLYYPNSDDCFLVLNEHPVGYKAGYVTFSLYDSDLNSIKFDRVYNGAVSENVSSLIATNKWQLGDQTFPTSDHSTFYYLYLKKDTKIFSSQAALSDYLLQEQSIYIMSDISSRLTEMTLNLETFQYDWAKANEESLKAIIQAIKDSKTDLNVDTLTQQQLQDVIDKVITQRLQDITDAINKSNQDNSFQNQLIYEKLEQIYQLLTKWYNSQDIKDIVDDNPLENASLEGLLDVLNTILEEVQALHRSVLDIDLTVINNNTFNTEFDIDIMLKMRPSVDKMKTTFPFCLPWDVYYCFASLAADPEVPHWEIPVVTPVGEYSLVIDLSDFQMLSDISRSLLTLIFIVYLSKFSLFLWRVF